MKFSISTAKINSILSKVQKGVGSSKIMPITEYLKIDLFSGILSVTSTDLSNFITVIAEEVEGEEGSVIVQASALIKLVSKTTKPEMTFTSAETHLEVKGNGTYKIPTLETAEFPHYEFDSTASKTEIETSVLKRAFQVNKSSIAVEMLMPCLTGYNVGSKVVTTDGVKMCINDVQVFAPQFESVLVTQTLADLVSSLTGDKVTIQKDKNKLLFSTDNIIIFGTELDGIEEYPDITPILGVPYSHNASMSKGSLLNALDRLSIFVDPFDNNGVTLTFKVGTLVIEDLKKNSSEEIEFEGHVGPTDGFVTVAVNIDYLKDLISVLAGTNVHIEYGEELPLKIVEDSVTQILSTMSLE